MKKKVVGSRMKQKRKELGFTQKDVAKEANISDRYYGQIERGECSPSLEVTDKIAKALETSFNWIVNDRAEVMEFRVNEEIDRLKKVLKDIPDDKMKTIDGLITQAARLRILLDDNWKDIAENGEYEMFSQSKNQTPYERKRPIVETYDNRDRTYKEIMNQLNEMIPAEDHSQQNKKSRARNMLLGK
jgi:transcriptional regulator with XRE-family HTH domain